MLQQSDYTVLAIPLPESQLTSVSDADVDADALDPEELADLDAFDDLGDLRNPNEVTAMSKSYFNLTYLSHDFHSQYHPASNITLFLRSLAQTFPNYVKLKHVGHSFLGRRILSVKISSPEPAGKKGRQGFVILGAQHAREVSSSLFCHM